MDKKYYENRISEIDKDLNDVVIEAFNDFMAVAIKTSQKQQKLAQKRQELLAQQKGEIKETNAKGKDNKNI